MGYFSKLLTNFKDYLELRTNYYSSFTQGRTCKINLYIVNLCCDILLGLWQVWDKKENHLLKLVYLKKSILQYFTCEPASLSLCNELTTRFWFQIIISKGKFAQRYTKS
jgi:hypothetical protein